MNTPTHPHPLPPTLPPRPRHSRPGLPFRLPLPLLVILLILLSPSLPAQTNDQRSLILVIGNPGEAEYVEQFTNSADLWQQAAVKGGLSVTVIGRDQPRDDRARLLKALSEESSKPGGELWLVFLGHGTFDGHTAKFNLRGPDVSAEDIATALKPCTRPLVVIQCASASGPFLTALSAPGRVIITATRSGNEANATRFGNYFARAIADPAADLDKDGQTSVLEAYLLASRQVQEFYREDGRMLTEHALLDDNGDGLGTPADWFHGVYAVKKPAEGKSVDGVRAAQMVLLRSQSEENLPPSARARRDELEKQLSDLRSKKSKLSEDDYYTQLETIVVEISRLYQDK